MQQFDRAATRNVLHAMSVAGVDLDQLASATGISKEILLRRMGKGPWKVRELGLIAHAVGCRTADLVAFDGDAA